MKRIVIAGAVLQGVKIAQAARDLRVSRSWASREAHHPETQRFIAPLQKQDPETAIHSLQRALKAIADIPEWVGCQGRQHHSGYSRLFTTSRRARIRGV